MRIIILLCLTLLINIYPAGYLYADNNLDSADNFLPSDFDNRRKFSFFTYDNNNNLIKINLERIDVFSSKTAIKIHHSNSTEKINIPEVYYFYGQVESKENSHVFFRVDKNKDIKGLISLEDKKFFYSLEKNGEESKSLNRLKEINSNNINNAFSCLSDKKTMLEKNFSEQNFNPKNTLLDASNLTYIANLTLETDYEYYNLFNDTTKAVAYTADLVAYTSSIYSKELNTLLKIKELNIYTSPDNPWQGQDTDTLLTQLQNVYRSKNTIALDNSATHLLSGKRIGGLAYINTICNSTTNLGVSGGLYGTFNINDPKIVWDAKVFAHELGHTFGATHTHNYLPNPVDCCYSENPTSTCAAFTPYTELPGINSLTGGLPNTGTGTIMSYCHKVTGKLNNITLTLGKNHPYGVNASRIPAEMRLNVLNYNKIYPQCFSIYFPGFKQQISWSFDLPSADHEFTVGDFNGDGKDDLLEYDLSINSPLYIRQAGKTHFLEKRQWLESFNLKLTKPLVGDFNGDGKDDLLRIPISTQGNAILVVSDGEKFLFSKKWQLMKPEVNGYFLTGDFDGDHGSDIAFLSKSNNFYVSLSKESSFLPFQKWFGYRKANIENLSVGDFNGDGKDDVAFYNNLDSNLYVRTSTGAKFSPSYIWLKLDNVSKDTLLSADVNADHVADLLIKDTKGFYITLSDGYGFEEPQSLNNFNNKKHILFGKFNEDQADDLLEINQDSHATMSSLANAIE